MAHGGNDNFEQQLEILERKFLCCYPLHEMNIELLPKPMTLEQQELLMAHTYAHSLNKHFPIKVSYQLKFLKSIIALLEGNNNEIHETIYEAYCDELQRSSLVQSDLYAYKHYILPDFKEKVTLRESKSFVAKGSTGLCSWQASLALTDYLLCNPEVVEQKTIVEIGAGTGLCGIIVKKCLNTDQYIMTDGSNECVKLMDSNILINFDSSDKFPPISSKLQWDSVCEFPWEFYKQPHLVLAADVIYDSSDFLALTYAITYIFHRVNSQIKMLLAATVRNQETLKLFIEKLTNLQFLLEERDVITPDKSHLYWDRSTPIKIYEIVRKKPRYEETKSLCQSTSELTINPSERESST